ncbi:MAG: Ig-like domain-containing protein [Flavobacteriaceae bacterium]|nr:Ig-like domain-containing protein [Flavobacteriaceae bacterium]
MKHRLLYIPIAILLLLSFTDCAKKGRPSGGARDTIAPTIVRMVPENYSINFDEDEIRITFDEYIKLNELQKNLIISPPLKYPPIITPLSTSKTLKIKINDTLKENTTYSINFGQSIVDNNEGNPYEYFKYVFSTGTYIDSLSLKGRITDALLPQAEAPTTVMLYEVNETFTDSIVYTEKPTYIAVTTDSTSTFELTNLKEGTYLLMALKESSPNYTFQPATDKIAFESELITLPTDSIYDLKLFKEKRAYRLTKPKHEGKTHIIFGYEGIADSLRIRELSTDLPADYTSMVFKDRTKDTLHYWFRPSLEKDSLVFAVQNKSRIDTVTARLRNLFQDTLKVSMINKTVVLPRDTLKLESTTPIVSIDSTLVNVFDKDTLALPVKTRLDPKYNIAQFRFPMTADNSYQVTVLPGALTDLYGKQNDTLSYLIRTKPLSDYGTMQLRLENVAKYPIIVQLVDSNFDVVRERYLTEPSDISFEDISPAKYYIRIIYDDNENGRWDSGNFLNRKAPEKVIYYPTLLDIRSNFNYNETFRLK